MDRRRRYYQAHREEIINRRAADRIFMKAAEEGEDIDQMINNAREHAQRLRRVLAVRYVILLDIKAM